MSSWEIHGACRDHDLELWFPEKETGQDNHGAEAKRICATCPVSRQCLIAALDRGERHGIWGGAGGDLLRWLRRLHTATMRDPHDEAAAAAWADALDVHRRLLAGENIVINRNGPGATHGLPVTYNRGCRCAPCCRSRRAPGRLASISGQLRIDLGLGDLEVAS